MSTGQSAVMLCGCGVKAEWLILFVDKRVGTGWQVKLCDPSLTRAILSDLEVSSQEEALYKRAVFNFNLYGR